jgi:hypothetical protein
MHEDNVSYPLTIWRLKLIFFTHETSVRTSQWPQFVAIRKPGHVFLPVWCDNHIKRTNNLCRQNAVFRVTVVGGVNCNHSYLRVNYLCDNAVYVSQLTITFPYPTPAMDICTVDKRLGLTLFPIHGALPTSNRITQESILYSDSTDGSKKKYKHEEGEEYCEPFLFAWVVHVFEMPRNVLKPHGRRRRWKGNTKMNVLGIQDSVHTMTLPEDRGHVRAFVPVVLDRLRICMYWRNSKYECRYTAKRF